jgi:hypothetical protein
MAKKKPQRFWPLGLSGHPAARRETIKPKGLFIYLFLRQRNRVVK